MDDQDQQATECVAEEDCVGRMNGLWWVSMATLALLVLSVPILLPIAGCAAKAARSAERTSEQVRRECEVHAAEQAVEYAWIKEALRRIEAGQKHGHLAGGE